MIKNDLIQSNLTKKYSVLLDISVLIAGNIEHRSRTGVYTVTAKIFEHMILLHKKNDIFLSVCLPHSTSLFVASLKFYFEQLEPIGIRLYFKDTLPQTDIYHSTFHALPKRLKSKSKFITLYDLIPIKLSSLFSKEDKVDIEFLEKINSLTKENWVLSISQQTRQDYHEYNPDFPLEHSLVIPLAADPQKFYICSNEEVLTAVAQKYQIPDAPYILSVCTLEPRKNLKFVVQGFLRLLQENKTPDLHLVLVGTKG